MNINKRAQKQKYPWNATKQYPIKDKFIIIPFSRLYYIWCFVLFSAIFYNLFIIPFTIAFEYSLDYFIYPIDVISLLIFTVDIFMSSKIGFNSKLEITTNLEEVSKNYIESRLFLDALSVIPIDYLSKLFTTSQQFIAFCRILRVWKFLKIVDYLNVWRKYYLGKKNFWYISFMVFVFIYLAHLNACIFYFIGKIEVGRHNRFDGQSLFSDLINRNFLSLSPVLEMSLLEKYCHFMYLGTWTVGGTIYGDIIPYAMSEQLFNQVTTFLSRIVVAFIYAQASGYISSIYMTYSNHIESKNMLIEYLEIHNIPSDVRKRVNKYYEILWNNFRGMDEDEIMGDLPESITKQIKLFVFSGFAEKLTIFPKEDKTAITSLLTRLKINLVPEGEYIIREREIRDCIYFIIRGSVLIVSGGTTLATLEQGAIFGEMAIAEKIPTVRNASAYCITPVWVGSLSIDDFKIICTSYPSFERKIQTEVEKRKADNLTKTPNIKFKEQSKTASPLKRPSRFINNFEKSWSALSRISKESSKKESRQSVYEIDEEEKLEQKFFKNALLQRFNYSGLKNKVKMKVYSFNNQRYQNLKNDSNSNKSRESSNSSHKQRFIDNPNVPHSIVESSSDNINQLHISKSNSQNKSSSKSKESIEPNLQNLKPVSIGWWK